MHLYYPVHSLVALYATESLNVWIREKRIKTSRVTYIELDKMNGNQCAQLTRMVGTGKDPKSPPLGGHERNK